MSEMRMTSKQAGPLGPLDAPTEPNRSSGADPQTTTTTMGTDTQCTVRHNEHGGSGTGVDFPDVAPPTQGPIPNLKLLTIMDCDLHRSVAPADNTSMAPPVIPDIPAAKPITMAELTALGAKKDKSGFFKALMDGAIASEKAYGVPASVILAQAGLESGWVKHSLGGFNLFGIKGSGPAGSTTTTTKEQVKGKWITKTATFAKFHNLDEAMDQHGKVFSKPAYAKAVANYAKTHNVEQFAREIAPTYASAKNYAPVLNSIIASNKLKALCEANGGH